VKKSFQFIILTCFVSWAVAGVAILFGLRVESGLPYTFFGMAYMFFPALCTIIIQKTYKEKFFRNLNISFKLNKWFLIAGIVPILYTFLTLGVNLLIPNVTFTTNYEGLLSILPDEQSALATEQLSKFPPIVFLLITIAQGIVAGFIALLLVNFAFYLYDRYIAKENIFTKVIEEY
jgi:hypothetical protein